MRTADVFAEPPQGEVIEKILQHCGLWQASAPRAPPDVDGLVLELDSSYSDSPIGSPGRKVREKVCWLPIVPRVFPLGGAGPSVLQHHRGECCIVPPKKTHQPQLCPG